MYPNGNILKDYVLSGHILCYTSRGTLWTLRAPSFECRGLGKVRTLEFVGFKVCDSRFF